MAIKVDIGRLRQILLQAQLQGTNPPLFQVINNLIALIEQLQNNLQSTLNALPTGGGGTGVVGRDGISGVPGMDGIDGMDGLDAIGIAGPRGATGATGATGTTIPGVDGIDGIDGIDGLSIVGPAGSPGPTGATGPAGSLGLPGADGLDGVDGMDGHSIVGPTGPIGATGPSGAAGQIGYGFDGYDGIDGYDGLQGAQGPPGPTGSSGAGSTAGTATLDFGAFPGASDANVAVTGQAAIIAGSVIQAWIRPEDTADHTADEHLVETIRIFAGNIIAGTGFTIYGFNYSQINEPVIPPNIAEATYFLNGPNNMVIKNIIFGKEGQLNYGGGKGTRIYGTWKVAWRWS